MIFAFWKGNDECKWEMDRVELIDAIDTPEALFARKWNDGSRK